MSEGRRSGVHWILRKLLPTTGGAPGQEGLADAGHVLDQDVPLAEEGHEKQPDGLILAHKDLAHVRREALRRRPNLLQLRFHCLHRFHSLIPPERTVTISTGDS